MRRIPVFATVAVATLVALSLNCAKLNSHVGGEGAPALSGTPRLDWLVFSPPDNIFVVELPAAPEHKRLPPLSKAVDAEAHEDEYVIFESISPTPRGYAIRGYVISVSHAPALARRNKPAGVLIDEFVSLVVHPGDKIIRTSDVESVGLLWREVVADTGAFGFIRLRLAIAGSRGYVLMYMAGSVDDTASARAERFFDSFRVLEMWWPRV